MGAVDDEPFEEDSRDLLLDHFRLSLGEQVQQHAAEVVSVLVGVAELVRHRVQEKVPPLRVQLVRELKQPQPRDGQTNTMSATGKWLHTL